MARDGGDIKFKSFETELESPITGSCSGCPSSLMTLKQGFKIYLSITLKRLIP